MHVSAIVLAAGKGLRLRSKKPKLLIKVNSLPIFLYSLKAFDSYIHVKDIVIVASLANIKEIKKQVKQRHLRKVKNIVLGGRERQDSVRRGLNALDSHCDLVLIHDGARPFLEQKIIASAIKEAQRSGAAIVGVPVKATIKKIRNPKSKIQKSFIVEKTLDRDSLWEIQTPQVFKKKIILEAFKKYGQRSVTDDASLVERLGTKVKVVKGSYSNIKITTPEDLVLAEAIAKKRR